VSDRRPDEATQEWRAIARGPDVLFHVCSWPDKRGRWTEEEFYAVGRSDWEDIRWHWKQYWPALGGTCVEIGCGAGRLTATLAADFERVVALDVSADLIELARRRTSTDVEFHQVDGPSIPLGDAEAEGVLSVHVFQHLERRRVLAAYLAEARRVLRPGGTLMVHIQIATSPTGVRIRVRNALGLWRSRRSLRRGGTHTHVRMKHYRVEDVFELLSNVGFTDVELQTFPVRSNGYHHSFWLARA
jgi:ubiquinone/menaquinone biosynthesis C-methylase UbiE